MLFLEARLQVLQVHRHMRLRGFWGGSQILNGPRNWLFEFARRAMANTDRAEIRAR
jgi:hypothetical protein